MEARYVKAGQTIWAFEPSVEVKGALVVYVEGHRVGYAPDASTALAMVRYHRRMS